MTARPFPLTKNRCFPHKHLRAADFEWERTYWGKTAAMNGRMLGSGGTGLAWNNPASALPDAGGHPRETALCTGGVLQRSCVANPAVQAATAPWQQTQKKIKMGGQNIPIGFLWIILLVIVMSFVLNHTKMGRYTRAIGSNKEATRLSGVNVKFYHVMAYVICGLFAGLAAIAYSAIFATVQPGSGAGFELDAIGGAIVGGTSMTGAVGSITGTLVGVFVICLLKTGLPFIGLTANWQQIITGLVLIAAVLFDILKRKREGN